MRTYPAGRAAGADGRARERVPGARLSLGEHRLEELLGQLAAPAPSPCGGATAAITAAMASSLVAMVARGVPGWEAGEATARRALELRDRLVELAQEDTDAVAGLVRLGSLPEAERAEALRDAVRVPAAIAEAATETAALAELAEAHGKSAMRPDATAARLLATAAARVAEEVVVANGG